MNTTCLATRACNDCAWLLACVLITSSITLHAPLLHLCCAHAKRRVRCGVSALRQQALRSLPLSARCQLCPAAWCLACAL